MSLYVQDVSGYLESAIGDAGLDTRERNAVEAEAQQVLCSLQQAVKDNNLPFASIGKPTAAVANQVEQAYEELADGARTLMFFGCGDAGLIGQAIAQYGGWGIPGVMIGSQKQRPVTRFYSSPDPIALGGALSRPDLDRARFVFVSKAGDVSTLCQAVAALEAVRQGGYEKAISKLFLFVTDTTSPGSRNGLRLLSQEYAIPCIALPDSVAETFAGLTAAGLLPAIARGLDIRKILEGASASIEACLAATNCQELPAAQAAALTVGLRRHRGCQDHMLIPFDDRLTELARYWAHLQSSNIPRDGALQSASLCQGAQERNRLAMAIGDGNAHSRCLTLLHTSPVGQGPKLPADLAGVSGLHQFAHTHLGDVVTDQLRAMRQLCREHRVPVREIYLPQLDETVLGAFLMDIMLEAVMTAKLLGADLDQQFPNEENPGRATRTKVSV